MVGAALVADGDGQVQHVRELAGLLGIAGVRGNHHGVARIHVPGDLGQHRNGVQVIHGPLEEALQLRGVQVHGDEAVRARQLHALGAHPGADGHAGLVLLVALAIAEVGHDQRAGQRAGALEGVHPEQDLHKFVVGMHADGLHQEHVPVAHGLVDAHKRVALREGDHLGRAQRLAHVGAHALGEGPAAAAGEDRDIRGFKHKTLHSFVLPNWFLPLSIPWTQAHKKTVISGRRRPPPRSAPP